MPIRALVLAVLLTCGRQPLLAQYDDVYYDPEARESVAGQVDTDNNGYTYSSEYYKPDNDSQGQAGGNEIYDDATLDDEEYDYYYSSRIKRFHRNYYAPDFYDPFYADVFYYNPYYYDPFMVRDIYAYSGGYGDYWRYRSWNRWCSVYPSYWNNWNWYYGYYPFGPGGSFGYFNNPWYFNYYSGGYDPWYGYGYGWGGRCGWYDRSRYGWYYYGNQHGHFASNNPKGTFYGSRRSGLTRTSKYGPVRLENNRPDRVSPDRSDRFNNPDRKDKVDRRLHPERQDKMDRPGEREANPDKKSWRNPSRNENPMPENRPRRSDQWMNPGDNQNSAPERNNRGFFNTSPEKSQNMPPDRRESSPSSPKKRFFSESSSSQDNNRAMGSSSGFQGHQPRMERTSPRQERSFGGQSERSSTSSRSFSSGSGRSEGSGRSGSSHGSGSSGGRHR